MPTAVGFDPSVYTSTASTGFTLGAVYSYQDKLYRFVQVVTAAGANGVVFVRSGSSVGIVIGAARGGVAGSVVGVGVSTIAINSYGFILVDGTHTAVMCNGSTAGVAQKASATNDSCADTAAATSPVFGVALTTKAGVGTVTVDVHCV